MGRSSLEVGLLKPSPRLQGVSKASQRPEHVGSRRKAFFKGLLGMNLRLLTLGFRAKWNLLGASFVLRRFLGCRGPGRLQDALTARAIGLLSAVSARAVRAPACCAGGAGSLLGGGKAREP